MQYYIIPVWSQIRAKRVEVTIWKRGKACGSEVNTNCFPSHCVWSSWTATEQCLLLYLPFWVSFQISFHTVQGSQTTPPQFNTITLPTWKSACVHFSLWQSPSICADRDRQLSCITECNCCGSLYLDGQLLTQHTKIFISNLFAVLGVTVEWTTKSAFNEIVAVTTSGSETWYKYIEQSCFRKRGGYSADKFWMQRTLQHKETLKG